MRKKKWYMPEEKVYVFPRAGVQLARDDRVAVVIGMRTHNMVDVRMVKSGKRHLFREEDCIPYEGDEEA